MVVEDTPTPRRVRGTAAALAAVVLADRAFLLRGLLVVQAQHLKGTLAVVGMVLACTTQPGAGVDTPRKEVTLQTPLMTVVLVETA